MYNSLVCLEYQPLRLTSTHICLVARPEPAFPISAEPALLSGTTTTVFRLYRLCTFPSDRVGRISYPRMSLLPRLFLHKGYNGGINPSS